MVTETDRNKARSAVVSAYHALDCVTIPFSFLHAFADAAVDAVSTDAEPVAWRGVGSDGVSDVTQRLDIADQWRADGIEVTTLYAEPVKTAPAVAVKALEWRNVDETSNDVWDCVTDLADGYSIARWWLDDRREEVGHFEVEELGEDQFGSLEEAQAAAQTHYAARILSALSAQVQDVAGKVTVCVGEQTIARLRNGLAVEFDNGLALIPSSDLEDDDIGPHEKALRDAVEPFLDWLEQREAGAHIADVREGLIGVEDVIPDDHVVLGAHLRAQKDDGVLTIGHFRRLQSAYDGALPASPASKHGDAE